MGEATIADRLRREHDTQHLRGYSDDMDGQNMDGTWETFVGPLTAERGSNGEEPSYKGTKGREAVKVADGVVVPMKSWKQDRGKDPC
jgi:hypothetical protein